MHTDDECEIIQVCDAGICTGHCERAWKFASFRKIQLVSNGEWIKSNFNV